MDLLYNIPIYNPYYHIYHIKPYIIYNIYHPYLKKNLWRSRGAVQLRWNPSATWDRGSRRSRKTRDATNGKKPHVKPGKIWEFYGKSGNSTEHLGILRKIWEFYWNIWEFYGKSGNSTGTSGDLTGKSGNSTGTSGDSTGKSGDFSMTFPNFIGGLFWIPSPEGPKAKHPRNHGFSKGFAHVWNHVSGVS